MRGWVAIWQPITKESVTSARDYFERALDPAFTIQRFLGAPESDNPVFLTQRERIAESMRKAGVPEG
jgi:hypothetical protein